MQLIILGKNSDDKGSQLEKLTTSILRKQGYSSICTNVVKGGGSEIDVTGLYVQPFLGTYLEREVIGECKAYNNPIALPEWLKFLGKIFSEEVGGKKVQGCFIALSGVNGNVIGHYNAIRSSRQDIVLLFGEALFAILINHFDLKPVDVILVILAGFTQKSPVNSIVCYYENKFYWRVSFSDNNYTLLSNQGEPLTLDEASNLHEYIIKGTDLFNYVDLKAEKEAQERSFILRKYIVCVLLIEGTKMVDIQILDSCKKEFINSLHYITLNEVQTALSELETSSILSLKNEFYELRMLTEDAILQDVVNFYKFFFLKTVVIKGLLSKLYSVKINEALMEYILEVQGGIIVPEENFHNCLQILKWSPSALAWSLNADPIIINHRVNGSAIDPKFEKFDTDYFIEKLYTFLSMDFRIPEMSNYFFESCGLIEVDTTSTIVIKDEKKNQLSNTSRERIALGKMGEEYNNQVISIRML
ncbi:MAG: hypothetical protein ACO1OF_00965 [Adhaeribacter sp.]